MSGVAITASLNLATQDATIVALKSLNDSRLSAQVREVHLNLISLLSRKVLNVFVILQMQDFDPSLFFLSSVKAEIKPMDQKLSASMPSLSDCKCFAAARRRRPTPCYHYSHPYRLQSKRPHMERKGLKRAVCTFGGHDWCTCIDCCRGPPLPVGASLLPWMEIGA